MPPALPSTSSGCLSPHTSLPRECTSRGHWCSLLPWVSSPSRRSNQTTEQSVQPWNCATRDVQIHVSVRMPLSSGEPQCQSSYHQGHHSFVRLFIHSSISYVHKKMLSRAHHGHACLLRMWGRGNAANFTVRSLHQANQCSPPRLATHREVSMLGVLVLRLESEMSPTVMTLHRDTYGAMWKWGPWTRMQSSWLLPQHPACTCAATVPAAIMD